MKERLLAELGQSGEKHIFTSELIVYNNIFMLIVQNHGSALMLSGGAAGGHSFYLFFFKKTFNGIFALTLN